MDSKCHRKGCSDTIKEEFGKLNLVDIIEIRRCGIDANEITLHKKPNDVEVYFYGLQQLSKPMPQSKLVAH